MLKKLVIAALVSLILGGGIGYLIGSRKDHPAPQTQTMQSNSAGTHGTAPDVMIEELRGESGSSRDEAFLEMMIVHHQAAIDMSQILLESTKRPELKELAGNIITAQQSEITAMQNWLKEWYGR